MVDRTVETLTRIASTLNNIEGLMAEHNALVALDKLTQATSNHRFCDEMERLLMAANISRDHGDVYDAFMHIAKIADSK